MITFNKLGKHGNLGNHLFQIASLIGLGEKFGQEVVIPQWKYYEYFDGLPPVKNIQGKLIEEKNYHYDLEQFSELKKTGNYDILGWLQSRKYFSKPFKFKESYAEQIRKKYNPPKDSVCVSIRRGDYVGNPNYELLEIDWYYQNIPDNFKVYVFSDDIDYCKIHLECLPDVEFIRAEPIEQLCLMSLIDVHVIANSSFSWWGAYLSKQSLVINSGRMFAGEMLRHSIADYYPTNWIKKEPKRTNLKNVTFIIPVSYDHKDRIENLNYVVAHLQKYFDTNIIVGEQGGNYFEYINDFTDYVSFPLDKFHRTLMLNTLTDLAQTEIVFNYDADVLVSPCQILEAVERLKTADFVFPYDGRFARVPRTELGKLKYLDVGQLKEDYKGTRSNDMLSVGGCIGYRKKSFIEAGGENENFISYAPEDLERVYRFEKLGYKVERIKGKLFHLDHYVGENSSTKHEDFKRNNAEFDRIKKLDNMKGEVKWKPFKAELQKSKGNILFINFNKTKGMTFKINPLKKGVKLIFNRKIVVISDKLTQDEMKEIYDNPKHSHLIIAEGLPVIEIHEPKKKQVQEHSISILKEQPKDVKDLNEVQENKVSKRRGRKPKTDKN